MRRIILVGIAVLTCLIANAQYNVMQDGDGESSFPVTENNFLNVNAEAKKIAFSITIPETLSGSDNNFWSLSLSLKGANKSIPIIKSGEFNAEGNLTITRMFYGNSPVDAWYVSGNVGIGRVQVLDSTVNKDDILSTVTPWNIYLQGGYISDNLFESFGDIVFGISLRLGWTDNRANIKSYQLLNPIISNGIIVSESPKDVYLSQDYLQSNFGFSSMVDIGWNTGRRIHPMAHFRLNQVNSQYRFNPGIGLYFSEKGAPLQAVFGLQAFVNDLTDTGEAENSAWDRTSLNIVVGFPIN